MTHLYEMKAYQKINMFLIFVYKIIYVFSSSKIYQANYGVSLIFLYLI